MNTNTGFLPKGYEVPKTSGSYYKFEKGANRFRIMSSAVVGWMYWTKDNKPVRSRTQFREMPADARIDEKDKGQFRPKHFWAFIVWNYDENKLQLMEITQNTIMSAMQSLVSNEKWGAPQGYDIVVNATGDGLDREYAVVPEPHTPAPDKDVSGIYLDELFTGGDPFNATTSDGKRMPNFGTTATRDISPEEVNPFADEEPTIN